MIVKWLFGTPVGRGVLLGAGVAVGLALGWWVFSSHYENVGYRRCQNEQLEAANRANVEQARKNAESGRISADVGRQTAEAANTAVRAADDRMARTKETIENVYSRPPENPPASFGSCVHPVDERVQDDIDAAVRRANASPGSVQTARGASGPKSAP